MRGAREQWIAQCLRTWPPLRADVIVVLCGEDMKPRADVGYQIFQRGYAPKLLLSGGIQRPPRVEGAEAAYSYLAGKGIATDRILRESTSQNTHEQAVNVLGMAEECDWSRLILVASEYHLPRAVLTFVQALIRADKEKAVQIIPVSTSQMPWRASPEGVTKNRRDLLTADVDKAEAYTEHVASFAAGLSYFEHWESQHVAA